MRTILSIILILNQCVLCLGQTDTFNYGDTVSLQGKVVFVMYEMPTDELFETYVLRLDKKINLKPNDDWEGQSEVTDIHLNIMNNKIKQYQNQNVKVSGVLFHALTIHHRRDVCIKVENINKSPERTSRP